MEGKRFLADDEARDALGESELIHEFPAVSHPKGKVLIYKTDTGYAVGGENINAFDVFALAMGMVKFSMDGKPPKWLKNEAFKALMSGKPDGEPGSLYAWSAETIAEIAGAYEKIDKAMGDALAARFSKN